MSSPGPDDTAVVGDAHRSRGQPGRRRTRGTRRAHRVHRCRRQRHQTRTASTRSLRIAVAERAGHPEWTDPTVRRASEVIGGPLGRHALVGRAPILTPLRVCLLMAIFVLIGGWLFKSACIQTGENGQLDQSGQRPWITGCYNDVVPLFGGRGLDNPSRNPYAYAWAENDGSTVRIWPSDQVTVSNGQVVGTEPGNTQVLSDGTLVGSPETGYSKVQDGALVPIDDSEVGTVRYLEYPVVTGYWLWGVAWLTHAYLSFAKSTHLVPVPLDVAAFFTIGAILLGLMYLWVVSCTAKIARRRIWDTAIMCLSPLLVVHAFTNWDLIAVGLTGGAMLAWARKRPVLAGVLFGLGAAAKLYPAFLLGPLLILCLRSGRMPAWTKAFVAAVITWVLVNLPIYLAYPDAWGEFYRMNTSRGAEWDSWYFLFSQLTGSSAVRRRPAEPVERTVADPVRRRLRGDRMVRPVLPDPSPVRRPGVPCGRRVPADQQGVVAAVLTVAGAAGRPGDSAVALGAGLAVRRGAGLDAADVVLRQRPRPEPLDLPVHRGGHRPGRAADLAGGADHQGRRAAAVRPGETAW